MAFFPARRKNTAVVPAPVFRNPETQQLIERFENIKNIADPADRLLMLEKVRREADVCRDTELNVRRDVRSEISVGVYAFVGTFAGAVAGVLLFTTFPLLAPLLFIPGCLAGGIGADVINERRLNDYNTRYNDIDVLDGIKQAARSLRDEILETVDTKVIARSPRGVDAFTKFPALKDKFMLALAVDRVNADERDALQVPDLGKVVKAPAGTPRVDL